MGYKVDVDIIVIVIGFCLYFLGGLIFKVDGKFIYSGEKFVWCGFMFIDFFNMVFVIGYVILIWILGFDLMSKIVIKFLIYMEK